MVRIKQRKHNKQRNECTMAFKYRNVYKSVMRHIHTFTKENKDKLAHLLRQKGYEEKNIKAAFETIRRFKPEDAPKEIEKKAKFRVDEMLKGKTAVTYIPVSYTHLTLPTICSV
eukprot:TRINITY_DN7236_c0_g1_i4.p3 TRINITY_DN7236_c0_g1~~TRINITY_DN7236_c0_g1_i4.p3  ORF type:complete len:114 (-),score=39.92 TRINITY_DN7236_c0_g1_i4:47-388(-)